MRNGKRNRGFSLIEVLVAMAVLAIALGIVGAAVHSLTHSYGISKTAVDQNALAETVADRLAGQRFSGKREGIVLIRRNEVVLDGKPEAGDQVFQYLAASAEDQGRGIVAVSVFSRTRKISVEAAAEYPKK